MGQISVEKSAPPGSDLSGNQQASACEHLFDSPITLEQAHSSRLQPF